MSEVRHALDAHARRVGARVLVLSGAGRGFCAGQDLGDRAVAPGGAERRSRRLDRALLQAAGARFAPSADAGHRARSTASPRARAPISRSPATWSSRRASASFVQAFSKLGLIPDSGGTWILPRLVGDARALGLTLLGDKLSAEQAAAWGMIWQCVEDAELSATVDALARRLAVAPTRGLAATKAAIRGGRQRTLRGAARRRARCAARARPLG